MPKADSSFSMLIVAAVVALGIGYYVPQTFSQKPGATTPATAATVATAAENARPAPRTAWAASAPGRVEPAGGEIRMSAQVPGRVAAVLVDINDKVSAGDLLVRLADEELVARVSAARAQVAVRKRDRDNENVSRNARDRREAEDKLFDAEDELAFTREALDRTLTRKRSGNAEADVQKARKAVTDASEVLEKARDGLRTVMAKDNDPPPTRLEAALAAARAELSLAQAALERTRIRAPSDGTVLRVDARVGETVVPSPENLLLVMGDVSSLRVRAELEERDIGKVRVGQGAVVRSDAFAGKDFEGTVSSFARALGPSKIGQRGPRKPTDIDVLEVIIDLTGQPPLLPGMRVDVFLKAEGPPSASAAPALLRRT